MVTYKKLKLFSLYYKSNISCAALTSLSLTGPQSPKHEIPCSCEICPPTQQERLPIWLGPLSAAPTATHSVLSLMGFISLPDLEIQTSQSQTSQWPPMGNRDHLILWMLWSRTSTASTYSYYSKAQPPCDPVWYAVSLPGAASMID